MTQTTRDYTDLEWDYTELAATYSLRPQYAARAIDTIVGAPERSNPRAADIGAGTGHLTLDLSARGCTVDAVEPNEAMRSIGIERTAGLAGVTWFVGIGEETGLDSGAYDLVTYGSSFSNTDQPVALRETARILDRGGWFACIWNHRKLDDPLQEEIEALIRARVPGYEYGLRRKDHAPVLEASGLFGPVTRLEEPVLHRVDADDWLVAWRSHATLQRQAGDEFDAIVDDIEQLVRDRAGSEVEVPYTTVGWLAQLR
jgi:ubiquinone/menaquinone biosynthesis C-methylase UbiE